MKIGNELNQTFLQYINWPLAVLQLPIALLCGLEINGVCAFRPPTACCICVSLIDRLGSKITDIKKTRSLTDHRRNLQTI